MKKLLLSLFLLAAAGMKLYGQTSSGDTTIYTKTDTAPFFPGAPAAFQNYVDNNKPKTEKINENRFVVARVIVEKDGRLTRPVIKYHTQTNPELDSAAIQLLKNSPAWKPAMKNGVPVRMSFNVQVRFETGYHKALVRAPDVHLSTGQNADVRIDDVKVTEDSPDKVFTAVEQLPSPPGGITAFYKFIADNNRLKGKYAGSHGKVIMQFIIEKDGSITNTRIVRSVGPEFDAEALRLIKLQPIWKPGIQNGRPVRVQYSIPVNFSVE
jgi:TonB family protein